MHGLKAKIHEFRLLVLHGEDDNEHDVVEDRLIKIEQTLSAVLNHVHNKCKETLSEVGVQLELVLNHDKSACTQPIVNDRKLSMELVTHMLDHR